MTTAHRISDKPTTRRGNTATGAIALVLTVAVAAAGCSSSKKKAASSTTPTATASATKTRSSTGSVDLIFSGPKTVHVSGSLDVSGSGGDQSTCSTVPSVRLGLTKANFPELTASSVNIELQNTQFYFLKGNFAGFEYLYSTSQGVGPVTFDPATATANIDLSFPAATSKTMDGKDVAVPAMHVKGTWTCG